MKMLSTRLAAVAAVTLLALVGVTSADPRYARPGGPLKSYKGEDRDVLL